MASSDRPDLLYIHPHGHLLDDWEVPIGAVTTANALRRPKLGLYAWECSDDHIRSACVVAVDWYWHFSLPAVRAVVDRVRRLSPTTPIVVGGLTAAWFGPRVFELLPVDFLAIGDAEAAIGELVDMAEHAHGTTVPPNTLRSDGRVGPRVSLDPDQFDALDPMSRDWFPSLPQARPAPVVMLTRGCAKHCGRICLAEAVTGSPLRIHSASWVLEVVRAARRAAGPGVPIRLVNVGAHDESRLIGILDRVAADEALGPFALWTYGLSRDFLDYVLDRLPDAQIGLLSPWEVLGWPDRDVSEARAGQVVEPVEQLVERLRRSGRGGLTFHVPRRFLEERRDLAERVGSDRTTWRPSDGYYIWTPERPVGRDLSFAEQTAKMTSMGALAAHCLLTEKVIPSLTSLYPMRQDPNPEPAAEPPFPELAEFHGRVLEGWRKDRVHMPSPFDFEVHLVRARAAAGDPAALAPSQLLFADGSLAFDGVGIETTATGVELDWTSPALPPSGPEPWALVVLPRGLGDFVRNHPVDVLCFPAPAPARGARLRLVLRVSPAAIDGRARWEPAEVD